MGTFAERVAASLKYAGEVSDASKAQLGQLNTALGKVSDAANVSSDLRTNITDLQRSTTALKLSLRSIPPIPAGPIGPIITAVKKAVGAVATALESGLKSANTSLKSVDQAVDQLRRSADGLGNAAGQAQTSLDKAASTLKNTTQGVNGNSDKLNDMPADEADKVLAALTKVDTIAGELHTLNQSVAGGVQQINRALAPVDKALKGLKEHAKSLKELRDEIKPVTDSVKWLGAQIKSFLNSLPWWAKSALDWIQGAIEWILEQSGIMGLLNRLGTYVAGVLDPLLASLNAIPQVVNGLLQPIQALGQPVQQLKAKAMAMESSLGSGSGGLAAVVALGMTAATGGGKMIFRGMKEEGGKPKVWASARGLGVRDGTRDIDRFDLSGNEAEDGVNVHPNRRGMSAAIGKPQNLPASRRPVEFGGSSKNKDPVWRIPEGKLTTQRLQYASKAHNPVLGYVQPSEIMAFTEYEQELAKTRNDWTKVVGPVDDDDVKGKGKGKGKGKR